MFLYIQILVEQANFESVEFLFWNSDTAVKKILLSSEYLFYPSPLTRNSPINSYSIDDIAEKDYHHFSFQFCSTIILSAAAKSAVNSLALVIHKSFSCALIVVLTTVQRKVIIHSFFNHTLNNYFWFDHANQYLCCCQKHNQFTASSN